MLITQVKPIIGKVKRMKKIANWIISKMCFLSAMLILSSIVVCFFVGMGSIKTDTITPLQGKIMLVCLGVMISQMLLCLCSRWLPKWYACDGMGWHIRPKVVVDVGRGDFTLNNGTCPRCHKEVMQDSQGNWF